jgi:myo-inositol-1(or 4)-monophosphatase
MLDFIVSMARDAGKIIAEKFGRSIEITYKGDINIVTDVDVAAEKLIIDRIMRNHPDHSILTEESGCPTKLGREESDWCWIIDPLDGTTNFAHGYPVFAVSIGLENKGKVIAGAVYDPLRDEMFAAERGKGTTLNGKTVKVSEVNKLNNAMVCTGFPYNVREKSNFERHFVNFIMNSQAVRRDGSAARDLAYVACGRFDGFWEEGLHPWDVAAGLVLVEEAGGKITQFDGSPIDIYSPPVVASNNLLHHEMIRVLAI